MPTIFSHVAVPLAIGLALGPAVIPPRLLVAGVAASVVPDLDVIGFHFDFDYVGMLGHRGFSHSLAFALFLGLMGMLGAKSLRASRATAFLFIAASAASHGLLDMLTNGGRGVMLWWPFSTGRLYFPWRVIEVSPLGFGIFSDRGVRVLQSELLWIWLPAIGLVAGVLFLRRIFSRQQR